MQPQTIKNPIFPPPPIDMSAHPTVNLSRIVSKIDKDFIAQNTNTIQGLLSKFTFEKDLLLLRKVAACISHVVRSGETKERFEIVAIKENATKHFHYTISWKSLQYLYKRIQSIFDRGDLTEHRMSGIGEEVWEMDDILAIIKENR